MLGGDAGHCIATLCKQLNMTANCDDMQMQLVSTHTDIYGFFHSLAINKMSLPHSQSYHVMFIGSGSLWPSLCTYMYANIADIRAR